MSKNLFLLLTIAVILLAVGCDVLPVEESGAIQITLPEPVTSRSIDMAFCQTNVDLYMIVAYNATDTIYAEVSSANISGANVVSVPVGTYSVVVFAGDDYSSSSVAFLGSGLATDVIVTANQVTDVAVTLANLDMAITAPSEAAAGSTFEVSLAFALNNPVLALFTSSDVRLTDNVTHTFNLTETTGTWSGTASLTAPGAPGSDTISFFGSKLVIEDGGITIELGFDFGKYWVLPNCQNTNANIRAETVFPITFTVSQTGIGVTVEWGPA